MALETRRRLLRSHPPVPQAEALLNVLNLRTFASRALTEDDCMLDKSNGGEHENCPRYHSSMRGKPARGNRSARWISRKSLTRNRRRSESRRQSSLWQGADQRRESTFKHRRQQRCQNLKRSRRHTPIGRWQEGHRRKIRTRAQLTRALA
jgi:hypothetical protein